MAGALAGDVTIPKVGKLPKVAVYGGVAGVLGLIIWQNHKAKSAAATATTDPYPPDGSTGNPSDPNSTDPATGATYGDEAAGYLGASSGAGSPFGGSGGTAGTISSAGAFPWDGTYNNPNDPYSMDSATGNTYGAEGYTGVGPGGGTTPTGPPFSTNAQWSQYVLNYFVQNQYADIAGRTDAVGEYIAGAQVTTAQKQYIDDAIAVGGPPPVAGSGGFPPSIRVGGGSTTTTGTATVPKVVGMTNVQAAAAIRAVGLVPGPQATRTGVVNSQTPGPGTKVQKGSTVDIGIAVSKTPPPPSNTVTVPRTDGLKVGPAYNDIVRAGLVVANKVNSNWTVHSTSPGGGAKVAKGSKVTINAAP
jgi:hypothetical protein